MPSLEQFSFSISSLAETELDHGSYATEPIEEYWLAFSEWGTCHNELEWLSQDEGTKERAKDEAIARYRKEMLELLKDVPEEAYELSLRDLVELPKIVENERLQRNKSNGGKPKGVKVRKRHSRSSSIENGGFLLKMFLPLPWPGKKKKSSRRSPSGSLKSDSGSSKSGSNVGLPPKFLLNDGGKVSSEKSLEEKSIENHQHGALSKNISRRRSVCYPFFLIHTKSKSRS